MKKWFGVVSVVGLALSVLVACGGAKKDENVLRVGASQIPHAEILEQTKDELAKENIKLEIQVFQDYVLPNEAVESGQLDANYFQHYPWMEIANQQKGYHLVKVTGVHIEPFGAYSSKWKSVDQLKDGATVAIPNGTSEASRALILLEKQGLIKLNADDKIVTVKSITHNPKHLQFKLLESAMLPRVLGEVDLALINTNYVLQTKLNPLKDALFIEGKDSPYVNIIAAKKGKENTVALQKLTKALHSQHVRKFIEEKYKGAIVPAF